MKIYSKWEEIPNKLANDEIVEGCIVLEGGAWRGIYTQGVLDAMMEHGLNMQTTVGVSAGAMSGISYVSGQIGRSAKINLKYRLDQNYCGYKAMIEDHGITGFTYFFNELSNLIPLNEDRFNDSRRRFIAVATNIETGKAEYFENGKCSDIQKAIQASATVPYVSKPVEIDGKLYLDGGIADKVPYEFALKEGFEKIVVVRTRDKKYRKTFKKPVKLIDLEYKKYPNLRHQLLNETPKYNLLLDRMDVLEAQGRMFVIAPSEPLNVRRFENDMEKLGYLYELGYKDAMNQMDDLIAYLKK